jgi:branched-chain amino acid transport system ATP-binding protein
MLELRGISAGYETGLVLRDVDLKVPDHSVVALLGPNGAGKTTLLRVACGMLTPAAGEVVIDGTNVTGEAPYQLSRRGICHVPEGRGIFPALNVADNIRLQAQPGSERGSAGIATHAFPRLGERMRQVAGTLSGGEQQMLALAHAYVSNPSVILLDEVSMGLAPIVVDEIFAHLRELAAQGRSLLIVEQYVSRALALADFVYILERGRVRFAGEPGELESDTVLQSYLGALAT